MEVEYQSPYGYEGWMRRLLRYVSTCVLGVLLALLYFTAETIVDELGWVQVVRTLVRDGLKAVIESGYSDWLWWMILFVSGVTATLWADHAVRKWKATRPTRWPELRLSFLANIKANSWIPYASDWVEFVDLFPTKSIPKSGQLSEPLLTEFGVRVIAISKAKLPPHAAFQLKSNRPILWRAIFSNDASICFDLDCRSDESLRVQLVLKPVDADEGIITPLGEWCDSEVVTEEVLLEPTLVDYSSTTILPLPNPGFFTDVVSNQSKWWKPTWLRNIAAKRLR